MTEKYQDNHESPFRDVLTPEAFDNYHRDFCRFLSGTLGSIELRTLVEAISTITLFYPLEGGGIPNKTNLGKTLLKKVDSEKFEIFRNRAIEVKEKYRELYPNFELS